MINITSIKYIAIVILLNCCGLIGYSQIIKGKITGENSKILPFATIYIVEKQSGIASNDDGTYAIRLEKGDYTLRFQYVGYETQTKHISISENQTLNIQLKQATTQLKEVTVFANAEDPAYNIIRKAMAKAPYYANQLPTFTSNVYIKGNLRIDKVPKLFMKADSLNQKLNSEAPAFNVGDIYTNESVNEIIKTKDTIKQRVISTTNSYPESLESMVSGTDRFLTFNIYTMSASPIARTALANYKFKLEKSIEENGITIHHISVMPKTANPALYSGTIDIIERLWCVSSFDLSGTLNLGIFETNYQLQQNFAELESEVYQPVSYVLFNNFKMFGFKMFLASAASIKYLSYTTYNSTNLEKDSAQGTDTAKYVVSEKSKKLLQEIETLSAKENLSNREALKILKLLDQKAEEDKRNNSADKGKKNLEVKNSSYIVTVDSNAHNYDSIYWKDQRPIELSNQEQEGYVKKTQYDAAHSDTISDTASKLPQRFSWAEGFKWKINPTTLFRVNFTSDIFNTVDGFLLGLKVSLHKTLEASKDYEIGIRSQYAFSSQHFPSTAYFNFNYLPKKMGSIKLNVGRRSNDFNRETGVVPFINAFSSLFFKENFINFYDRTFVNISHQIEAFNGFNIIAGFDYEKQGFLENNTDYSFFFRSHNYRSNTPDNQYVLANPEYTAGNYNAVFNLTLEYTPEMYYRYRNDKKINLHSKFPTFSLAWEKGIAGFLGSESRFDRLELNIKQEISLGFFKSFHYNLTGGWFPDNTKMHFSNFKQFNIQEFPFSTSSLSNTYHTLKTYSPATNEWYLSGFAQYTSPYLLIKYLPFLDKTLIMENLYVSYLTTPVMKNYIETGYALTNIYLFANVGVFVGFDNFKYANWGLKLSISLPNL